MNRTRCVDCKYCNPENVCLLAVSLYGEVMDVTGHLNCEHFKVKPE